VTNIGCLLCSQRHSRPIRERGSGPIGGSARNGKGRPPAMQSGRLQKRLSYSPAFWSTLPDAAYRFIGVRDTSLAREARGGGR